MEVSKQTVIFSYFLSKCLKGLFHWVKCIVSQCVASVDITVTAVKFEYRARKITIQVIAIKIIKTLASNCYKRRTVSLLIRLSVCSFLLNINLTRTLMLTSLMPSFLPVPPTGQQGQIQPLHHVFSKMSVPSFGDDSVFLCHNFFYVL